MALANIPVSIVDCGISYTITNQSIRPCDNCNGETSAIFLGTLHKKILPDADIVMRMEIKRTYV